MVVEVAGDRHVFDAVTLARPLHTTWRRTPYTMTTRAQSHDRITSDRELGPTLAIIPARGGSRRIPRKNVRRFCGKPIIEYSIRAAIDAGGFDEVMVSTDDAEIAEIARGAGASVPFLRSSTTANDHAGLAEVVLEVLARYGELGRTFGAFCCLLPTAPFVTPERLRHGRDLLATSGADTVVPVVAFSYPIQRALRVREGRCSMLWPENYPTRSQDLEPTYHDCGQFYWMRTASLIEQGRLFAADCVAVPLPDTEVQDIDSEDDWRIAELKYGLLHPPEEKRA